MPLPLFLLCPPSAIKSVGSNKSVHAVTKKAVLNTLKTVSPLVLCLGLGLVVNSYSAAVYAQDVVTVAAKTYRIEAGTLDAVLSGFGQQSGVLVSVSGELSKNKRSSGLDGRYSIEQALAILLQDTGLTGIRQANGSYIVTLPNRSQPDVMTLGTLRIGESVLEETAYGPVQGYVAKRSAAGSKTDTLLIETPQSISVITRDQMEARVVKDIGEVVHYSAGVRSNTQGESSGAGGSNISIRGFGGEGTAGTSGSEYVDGLKVRGTNFASAGFSPYLFERVEILKGPSSVLYGQSTPAGVVNHVSKRPTETPVREVVARFGSFDHIEGLFDIGDSLDDSGQLLFRLTGLTTDADAQTDFTSRKRKAIAPAITWRPSEDTSITILTNYQDDDFEGGFVNGLPAKGTVLFNRHGKISRGFSQSEPSFNNWDRTIYSLGYLLEHRFNETWSVRQNIRYSRNELDFQSVFGRSLDSDDRTLNRGSFTTVEHADDIMVDNQAEAAFNTGAISHTLLLGIDYQRFSRDTLRGFTADPALVPTLDLFNPVYASAISAPSIYQDVDNNDRQLGVYMQDQIKYERWVLTLGGRYDDADSEIENNRDMTKSDESDYAFTGRAGLGYFFDNGIAPYISYAESFEPTFDAGFSGEAFEPTTGEQIEVGIKYQPEQQNTFVTLSVFDLKRQNVLTGDTVNPGFSVQTGEVRSKGVELEGVASLTTGLDITAAYTYLDVEITQSNDGDAGNTLAAVPTHWASLWGDYTIQAGSLVGLSAGLGVRYVGSTYGDRGNTFKVSDYTLVDASVQYDLGSVASDLSGLEVAVNATNLLDKNYIASCSSDTRCYFGVGRSVIATVKYQW